MSRTITRSLVAAFALTLTTLTTIDAAACGGGGGGGRGRTSGRLSIAYNRSVPHMASQAPRYGHNNYRPAPIHRAPVVHRQPAFQQHAIQQPIAVQPAIAQPQLTQPQPIQTVAPQPIATQPAAPAPAASAEQSALDALGSLGAANGMPQFGAPATPAHVGAWTATLPGDNRIKLTLAADGSFNWVANSRGKVSQFAGRFTVAGGQLTLVRADNQQLAGAWTVDTTGGFRFKLAGAQDNGLLFVRG